MAKVGITTKIKEKWALVLPFWFENITTHAMSFYIGIICIYRFYFGLELRDKFVIVV